MGVIFINPYRFGFSPLSLSPALWLDASDLSTITASSGAVSQWNDKSANSRNVAQATAARQPTTGANTLNGLNVLTFGGDDYLGPSASGFNPSTNGITAFAVVQHTDNGFTNQAISNQDGTGTGRAIILKNNVGAYGTFVGGTATNVGSNTASWVVMRVSCAAGSNKTLTLVQNATTTTTATRTIESATGGFVIGANKLLALTSTWSGLMAELVVFGSELSAGDMTAMDTYLNAKWAVY